MDGSASGEGNLATRQSAKRRYSTMAESHRSASPTGLATSTAHSSQYDPHYDSHYDNEQPTRRPRLETPQRLPFGYGFDYRRPVLSSTERHTRSPSLFDMNDQLETIDLTRETLALPRIPQIATSASSPPSRPSSQRTTGLPRFSRDDIIDISSGEDEEDEPPRVRSRRPRAEILTLELDDTFEEPDSGHSLDDTEFYALADTVDDEDLFIPDFSSRVPTPAADRRIMNIPRTTRSHQSSIPPNAHIVDLTDDDVEFIESRSRAGANNHEPTFSRGVQTRQGEGGDLITYTVGRLSEVFRASLGHANRLIPRIAAHYEAVEQARRHEAARSRYPERQFNGSLTAAMNVLHNAMPTTTPVIATSQNLPGQMDYTWTAFDLGRPTERRDRATEYEAPPPLPNGFTGSPTVDEPVVCPNCGDELAQGESELKRQVWVIKACGHAYCGECVNAKLQQPARTRGGRRDKDRDQTTQGQPPLLRNCVVEGCGKGVSKSTVLHVYLSE